MAKNSPDVVIVGNSADYHAQAISWAVKEMGGDCFIWDGFLAGHDDSFSLSEANDQDIERHENFWDEVGSTWFRRPVVFSEGISNYHRDYKDFIGRELTEAYYSLGVELERCSKLLVGSCFGNRGRSKIHQLSLAKKCGFNVPETLLSNDVRAVRDFCKRREGSVVKCLTPYVFNSSSGKIKINHTSRIVDIDGVSDSSIKACPAIYQDYIEKKCEFRITVIGNKIFPVRIGSSAGCFPIDWRGEPLWGSRLQFEQVDLPSTLQESVEKLIEVLGSNFLCIDLVSDLDGNVYFLEANPSGQFIFVDLLVPDMNLLREFSSMLLSASEEYSVLGGSDIRISRFNAIN